jgi:hypothetical protein
MSGGVRPSAGGQIDPENQIIAKKALVSLNRQRTGNQKWMFAVFATFV